MKTAYPKTLLIAFENITPPNPVDFSTSMQDMAYQYKNRSYKIKPYHLHPGNEVKLKRENVAMRKWIIQENGGQRSVKKCPCLRCKKLREVVTDW